jgi:hypothetical protein
MQSESRLRRRLTKARDDLMKDLPPGTALIIVAAQDAQPQQIHFSTNCPPVAAKYLADAMSEAMAKHKESVQ